MARVSIPGKVLLSGEYAVLYGAPALLLPAPRFLNIETAAPGDDALAPADCPAALKAALGWPVRRLEQLEGSQPIEALRIDSSGFFAAEPGPPQKLGLGLSAAESVAGIALRYEAAGLSWQAHRMEIARAAISAHYSVSQGGSGADSAACALGRPIRYQLTDTGPQIEPLGTEAELPRPSLPLNCVWSRHSADTRLLLGQFESWAEAEPAQAAELIKDLCARSTELAPLWFGSEPEALLEALDGFQRAMADCAAAAGLTWQLPAHARLEEWARRHGGRAKPTGAGGGDMILLVGELPLAQLGMEVLPLGGGTG